MYANHKPGADHPYEEHKEYDEDDSAGNSTGYVRELALISAVPACEGTGASAGRFASRVLYAFTAVVAEV